MKYQNVLDEVRAAINSNRPRGEILREICVILNRSVQHYTWVGFYLADDSGKELILGPYVGEPTEHARIGFGQGICGQAAARQETFVVQDVSQETNYLSCSARVKSEIVVPILKDGRVTGELDIDSHSLAPFTADDSALLEQICRDLGRIL